MASFIDENTQSGSIWQSTIIHANQVLTTEYRKMTSGLKITFLVFNAPGSQRDVIFFCYLSSKC